MYGEKLCCYGYGCGYGYKYKYHGYTCGGVFISSTVFSYYYYYYYYYYSSPFRYLLYLY
jgi:hypothetical protein